MGDVTSHILHSSDSSIARLGLAFKRYRPLPTSVSSHSGATRVALVFTHCVGTHKETWVPVIEYLYQFQSSASQCSVIIAEAWSMDSPNHGEAAAINEKALLERPQGITAYDWAKGVQTLLESGLISSDRLVSVGHSAGACVQVLSTISSTSSSELRLSPYSAMILVEPTMMTKEIFAQGSELSEMTRVIDAVKKRRDIWESREAARAWFTQRLPWKRWDARVLDAFVQYGLRDLPTAAYPDRGSGVTLSCTREQEASEVAACTS
ncbi:hypothetical protein B0H11DRAFT_1847506 [Mycena galericulata]|nr:hypothetical protein B0H11DRAFT_1847501 [Mycena galericulata]KAJ7509021.1 hypothetical protein B0H11DRAFT_1847506 [Mycena galericulata]